MEDSTAVVEHGPEFVDSAVSPDGVQPGITEKPRLTVLLPMAKDLYDIDHLLTTLALHKEQRGVITLTKWLEKYVMHTELANSMWTRAEAAAKFVSGERSKRQQTGDKKRSLRSDAEDFYNSLSTSALRLHCGLFSINYDGFDSQEEIIAELVQKHIDMVGV